MYDSNTDEIVNTYGVSAGFETNILNTFDLSGTYSYNKMQFDNPNSLIMKLVLTHLKTE